MFSSAVRKRVFWVLSFCRLLVSCAVRLSISASSPTWNAVNSPIINSIDRSVRVRSSSASS
jgi:hypothetical protein